MSMQPPGPWQNPQYPQQPQKSSTPTLLIVLAVLGLGGICALGVGAAIAIPAFNRFQGRVKTTEAVTNLSRIYQGITVRYNQGRERAIAGATPAMLLPPTAPRTPMQVPAGRRVIDPPNTWNAVAWQAAEFSLTEAHYYSYEYVNFGDGTFAVRAYGDLDGDGLLSTFERRGHVNPDGDLEFEPMRVTDELE